MMLSQGEIVLIPIPFSDLTSQKEDPSWFCLRMTIISVTKM